jgi:hypothetical protein
MSETFDSMDSPDSPSEKVGAIEFMKMNMLVEGSNITKVTTKCE